MDKTCITVQEMLPWLVNGSLEYEEKKLMLEHLAECAECRYELAFVIEMKKAAASLSYVQDKKQQGNVLDNMLEQIKKEDMNNPSKRSHSDEMLGRILKNPSPFGIMAAITNEVKAILNESTYEAREQMQLVTKSMKIINLYLQKGY